MTTSEARRGRGTGRTIEDVRPGEGIPSFPLPLTLQRLVIEAGVNRDFTPSHHDPALAKASGAPGPYANTLLIEAMLEAALRQWMGDAGRLAELDFRMVAFNVAGKTITAGGAVRGIDGGPTAAAGPLPGADWAPVELDVWLEDGEQRTVTGTATVLLPRRSDD